MKNKEIEELLNKFKNADSQQLNELVEDFNNVYKLLSYIEQLQKKVDQYENPEDLTLMFMYCDEKAKDKIKALKNNWNKLKEWLVQLQKFKGINQQGFSWGVAQEVLDKMQEIEGGMNE
jgi:hypothetical protein